MNFPDDTQRLSIIGSTGSGKTRAAMWHLSMRDYDAMPWIIYDFKRESDLVQIPFARRLELNEVPVRPGVYIVHPHPDDGPAVERQMWGIWERGHIGVYVDEGYMIGHGNKAFRSLLTQGRSKYVPMIVLSQRPVWMDRFVFSESEFFQIFRLQHRGDRKNVQEFVPVDLDSRIPPYYSWYYDVRDNAATLLKPVPDLADIHRAFARRLAPLKRVI